MDSKLLYNIATRLSPGVRWKNDWIYFGLGKEIKADLVREVISGFTQQEKLYLVRDRNSSRQICGDRLEEEIENLFGQNFQVWNEPLTSVIEFNKVGVLRIGENHQKIR